MLLNSFSFHFVVLRILMVNWPSGVVEFSNLFLWEEMEYLAIVVAWSMPSFKISARAECLLSFLCLPFPFYSKAFVHRFTFPTWLSCCCINYHINLVAVHVWLHLDDEGYWKVFVKLASCNANASFLMESKLSGFVSACPTFHVFLVGSLMR